MTRYPRRWMIASLIATISSMAWATAPADDGETFSKLLKEKTPAIVTVKFTLKVNMGGMFGGGEQENESEVNGVMIDAKGLVLCSNTQLSGFIGMMRQFMGEMGGNITATPTDLKILVGDDTEGRDAEIVARDTELDLAWVRMKEPGEQKYAYVDFSQSAVPKVGQQVYVLRRMGKFFARCAVAADGRIAGTTAKPRDLYVPAGNVGAAYGLPVFLADGKPVGVVVMQVPESEGNAGNPMAMLGRMSGIQDMMSGLILPAAEVVKATQRALETRTDK
ncbi:MAG: serine protease [Planctomycetota bacterium]